MSGRHRTRGIRAICAALALTAAPIALQAQQGTITGRLVDQSSGQPIPTADVYIDGLGIRGMTQANGRYLLVNVPAGTQTVVVNRIGYQTASQEVTLAAGATVVVDFSLSATALQLEGIVATGLVDPTAGVRAPISVGQVTRERMPVAAAPSGAVVENLAGRVAGVRINRTSGQPGEGSTMMLRSLTSLRGGGAPLIVVDGVVLGGEGLPATVDIESMDIESIEVVRGAAGASLYGSRANAGVISIKTARGDGLPRGETQFTVRSEYGMSQNVRNVALNNSHAFLMDPTLTSYVDAGGNVVPRDNRVLPSVHQAFLDNPFPGGVYDNIGAITHAGGYLANSMSIMGNEGATNFAVTYNNLTERGILLGNEGYKRNNFRVNVDHRFLETMSLGVSMYHSRDWRDNQSSEGTSNPFNQVLYAPRDVDLSTRAADGSYLQQPDPTIAYQNPIWTETTRDNTRVGSRTLANFNVAWSPISLLSFRAEAGYDRADQEVRGYVPKGTPADVGRIGALDGEISFDNTLSEAFNGSLQATVRRDFGSLNVRTTVRGLLEADSYEDGSRSGEGFTVAGVPQLSAIPTEDQEAESSERDIRALGALWDTALDYDGRYIVSVLGRRDGSSLFGAENRWHNYYRVAGAWRMAEESWFNIPNISELKLSAAQGTAGGRPSFDWQYETWQLSNGVPVRNTLGNSRLAPEHTTEREFGLNAIVFDRFGISFTYARQKTTGQLNPVPLPAVTGYSSQWINTGTVEGHSFEFELEAQLINRPNFGWTSTVVADYSNATITEWDVPCYAQGWRWNCENIPVYGIYSRWLVTDQTGLNQHDNGSAVPYMDEFEVNDEGYLVWVGPGNHYWEGMDKNLWGTSSPFTNSNGQSYMWGYPIFELTEEGTPHRTLLGEGAPANFGWLNTFRWGGFSLFAQLHASIGGQTNNRRFQLMSNNSRLTAPYMDQAGKPDELKKPIGYFRAAIDGDTSYTIEDSSYLKLRTVTLSYDFSRDRLERWGLSRTGLSDLSLSVTVRNVFTLTNYDGFDPESGFNLQTRASSDPGGYPPTRTLTAAVSATF